MSISEQIQAIPAYVTGPVAVLTVLGIIALPLVAGRIITVRARREGFYATGYDGPPEDYEAWWNERNAPNGNIPVRVDQKFGALDVTFAGVSPDPAPTQLLAKVPVSEEPTEENPLVPVEVPSEPVTTPPSAPDPEEELPTEASWVRAETKEWNVVEALEAEVVETEDEATRLFNADPLRSWVMPPLEEFDYLPEADSVFRDLVARNWLTGEGADVSADWKPWFTDSYELEGASA